MRAEDMPQKKLNFISASADKIEINLSEECGSTIGIMRPLTAHHLDQINVIKNLTDWRNANMAKFLTHFEATQTRTRAWLENILLKNSEQMLWLIYDQNNDLVGHFGYKNLTSQSVLLDNAMRGKRKGHPKLFVVAGKTMVEWLWKKTSIQRIDAYVMTDNVSSIMMNRQIGFQGWKRHPLIKRIVDGNIHWHMGGEGQESPEERYCFKLYIERDEDALKET